MKKIFQFEGLPRTWFTMKRKEDILSFLETVNKRVTKALPLYYEDANILVDKEYLRKNFEIPYSLIKAGSNWSIRKLGKMTTGFVSALLPLVPLPKKGPYAWAIDVNHPNYVKRGSGKKIPIMGQLTLQWEHYYSVVMSSIEIMFSRIMGEWKLDEDDYPTQDSDFFSLQKMIFLSDLVFATTASENKVLAELVDADLKKLGIDSNSFSRKTVQDLLYHNRDKFDELLHKFESAYYYKKAGIGFHSLDKEIYLPTATGYKLISKSGSTYHQLVPSAYHNLVTKKPKKKVIKSTHKFWK